MNRYIVFILIGVGLVAIVFLTLSFLSNPAQPQQQESQTIVVPVSGGGTVDITPEQETAIRASLESSFPPGNPDHATLQNTVIVGEYAIQLWQGDNTGGEALLKYNRTSNHWDLVDGGGGVWTLGALVDAGVPTSTAEAFLVHIPHS